MSKAIENSLDAQKRAMSIRPKVGGFSVLAETLRMWELRRISGTCLLARACI